MDNEQKFAVFFFSLVFLILFGGFGYVIESSNFEVQRVEVLDKNTALYSVKQGFFLPRKRKVVHYYESWFWRDTFEDLSDLERRKIIESYSDQLEVLNHQKIIDKRIERFKELPGGDRAL